MTLFVVLGLVAVVVGVLVAVALGVRSMRAEERGDDDWNSPVLSDSDFADPDDLQVAARGRSARARRGAPSTDPASAPGFGSGAGPQGAGALSATRITSQQDIPGGATLAPPSGSTPAQPAGTQGRSRTQAAGQPKRRTRQLRPRGATASDASDGWDTTNWDRVSDEDYWAELSADKPLASRTAQSAADLRSGDSLRSGEPARAKERDERTDPNLARPEPDTGVLAGTSGFSAARRGGADWADRDVAELPVRRSGSSTDTGVIAATSRYASPNGSTTAVGYTDPNLAVLASMGETSGGRMARHAAAPGAAAPDQPAAGVGAWPGDPGANGGWPQHSTDYASAGHATPAGGLSTSYYSAPLGSPAAFGSATTPSADVASAGHSPSASGGSGYSSLPPAPGYSSLPPAPSGGSGYSSLPPAPGYSSLPSSPAPASGYPAGSGGYHTPSHGMEPTAPSHLGDAASYGGGAGLTHAGGRHPDPSYTDSTPYAAGAHGNGSITPPHGSARAPATWGAPDPTASRDLDPKWQHGAPASPMASPRGDHTSPYASGHPGADSAAAAGALAYPGQLPSGGFASGYLSSSALSARQQLPAADPLGGSDASNPYGSYVGPLPGEGTDGTSPEPRSRHTDAEQHYGGDRGSYRGYGGYGGGSYR